MPSGLLCELSQGPALHLEDSFSGDAQLLSDSCRTQALQAEADNQAFTWGQDGVNDMTLWSISLPFGLELLAGYWVDSLFGRKELLHEKQEPLACLHTVKDTTADA